MEWFVMVCVYINYFFNMFNGMFQFIYFGVDVYEVNISVVDEGFYENLVGVLFKYQQVDFINGVEIGIFFVNVVVF